MKVEIITTGTELLLDRINNSNLAYLANQLARQNYSIAFHTTVPDELALMVEVIKTALKRAGLIIISGGLGPTEDDLTRQAVSQATRKKLCLNQRALRSIKRFFECRRRVMSSHNQSQAYFPEGARPLKNRVGTAPGFWLRHQGKTIIVMPGVPHELQTMFQSEAMPYLKTRTKGLAGYASAKLKLFGIAESHFQTRLSSLTWSPYIKRSITIASDGVITIRLTAQVTKSRADKVLARTIKSVKDEFGSLIFGQDNASLIQVVGQRLLKKKLTLATAESCTGGLLSHKITNIPGISSAFKEGLICYGNDAKIKRLDIPKQLIRQKGAVSSEVASLMARNIRYGGKTDIGLAITGIAGPGGGTSNKPVGLVYIGFCFKGKTTVKECYFTGNRQIIKDRATAMALDMLRRQLI